MLHEQTLRVRPFRDAVIGNEKSNGFLDHGTPLLPASLCSSSSPPPPLQSSDPLLVGYIHAHAEAIAGFKNVGEVGLGVELAHLPLGKGSVYQPLVIHC